MSGWLEPLRQALHDGSQEIAVFFRDDDVGWSDERLFALLDLFSTYELPLDLAVIPCELRPPLARELCARLRSGARLGVHQHGFRHRNHELAGRTCEFGPSRERDLQRRDIEQGLVRLREHLDCLIDPIFTPPWNRCTEATGACLVELGVGVLSRDRTAAPLDLSMLAELPVSIDWLAKRAGVRLRSEQVGELFAEAVATGGSTPIGIMLHHAEIDEHEHRALAELLGVLAGSSRVRAFPMRELVAAA